MEQQLHFLEYDIKTEDQGREVLSILRQDMALTTRKIRNLKQQEEGILLDGQRVTVRQKVEAGQLLQILLNDTEESEQIVPWDNDLEVLYEDEDLIFVNKPSGIVSHPSLGHKYDSLANIVKGYYLRKEEKNGIHLIGRLDKDTSGVLGIAKNGIAKERMIALRQEGRIRKEYLAVVNGRFSEKKGFVDIRMEEYRDEEDGYRLKMRRASDDENGMEAGTHYEVIWECKEKDMEYSLLRLWLDTGRMHQIRFHMSAMGHPLLGDAVYGVDPVENDIECNVLSSDRENCMIKQINRTALHAWKVTFPHPFTKECLEIQAEIPKDMRALLDKDSLEKE